MCYVDWGLTEVGEDLLDFSVGNRIPVSFLKVFMVVSMALGDSVVKNYIN